MSRFWIRLISLLSLTCTSLILLTTVIGHLIILPDNELVFAAYAHSTQSLIYRMDIAHRLIQHLTGKNNAGTAAVWSPDGQQIAFTDNSNDEMSIAIVDVLGNLQRRMVDPMHFSFNPIWSSNGRFITFMAGTGGNNPELYDLDLENGAVNRLTDNDKLEYFPTWSPDSQHIVFSSNIITSGNMDIFSLDVDTKVVSPLITTPDNDTNPAWSPNGRYLTYIVSQMNPTMMIYDSLSGRSTRLQSAYFSGLDTPDWSPDSRFIVYTAFVDTLNGIFRLDVQTCMQQPKMCTPQLLTPKLGYYLSPHWRPNPP